jgi:uncharacterized protein DUF3592
MRIRFSLYSILMAIFSIVCLVAGVWNYFSERDFLSHAELDTGTITDYELHVRTDGKSEYCPRIEFTTRHGEPVAVRGGICPNEPDESKIGTTEQVYYDPAHPEDYEEKDMFTGYNGLIFGLIGAVFFGLLAVIPAVSGMVRSARKPATHAQMNDIMRQDAERYRRNRRAAERSRAAQNTESSDEAELARLEQQEEELRKKIDERKRQQGQ